MNLFLQRMCDLYNRAGLGIDGIEAIHNAINIENQFRLNNDKLSLKRVTDDLGLEENYIAYKLIREVED